MVPYTFLLVAGVSAASQCEIDTDVISMIQAGKAAVGKTGDPWYKTPIPYKTVFINTGEPEPTQVKVYPRTTAGHIMQEVNLQSLSLGDHEFSAADMGENFHDVVGELAQLFGKRSFYRENKCGKCEWHAGRGTPSKSYRFAGGLAVATPLHDSDFKPQCICIDHSSSDNAFWGRDNCKQNDQRATFSTPANWQVGAQSDPIWHSDEFSDARVSTLSHEDQWTHHRNMHVRMYVLPDVRMAGTHDHEWLYSKSLDEFHAPGFDEAPACIPGRSDYTTHFPDCGKTTELLRKKSPSP